MNAKTTVIMFVLVVAVGVAIVVLKEKAPPPAPTLEPDFVPGANVAEKKLTEKEIGDPVTIVVQMAGNPEWRFERSAGEEGKPGNWKMTAPAESPVQSWQVDQIGQRLTDLTYTVKYEPGTSSSITATDAGLDPPRATVALTDDKGGKLEVQIGRHEADQETYVRLAGEEAICRVKPSLKNLLKDSALEYWDQRLFEVNADDIVRIVVIDEPEEGESTKCAMVKSGGEWRFEEPTEAKAVQDKIQGLCRSFSGLRAQKWVTDKAEDLDMYGLTSNTLTLRVTAEQRRPKPEEEADDEEAEAGDEKAEEDEQQDAPVTKQYAVQFSRISPLGEDKQLYMRRDEEHAVAVVTKTLVDVFKPNLKEWRDDRLMERDPTTTRKVTLERRDTKVSLVRAGSSWTIEESGEPADKGETEKLLKALKDTKAVSFVDRSSSTTGDFGLDEPQGVITLAFDEGDEPARITVGGPTDPTSGQLVYVDCGDTGSVAKVLLHDAKALLREPGDFRDRTVVAVPGESFEEVTIKRVMQVAGGTGRSTKVTLRKQDDKWVMTSPTQWPANEAQTEKLIAELSELRAQKIIDLDDPSKLAEYGLDDPQVALSYTYLPPRTFRMEAPTQEEIDATTNAVIQSKAVPYQPPPETVGLAASLREGKVYMTRGDDDRTVFVVGSGVMDLLTADYRKPEIYSFEASQVSSITVAEGDRIQGLRNSDRGWQYEQEGDLPIDAKKVTNYLLQLADLKIARVVEYGAEDLASYGLDAPQCTLSIEVEGKALAPLHISAKATEQGEHYARSADGNDVFVLPADALDRIRMNVEEFVQTS